MKKYVYLFELDSVRKTDLEVIEGQRALYEEIVGNGNTVVLTYNQLVDSRAFFSLLEDEKYFDNFVSLFEKDSIKISQYDDVRTISQYLLNALSVERDFIFSGWPLKSNQKRLMALIRRSLTYSDLTEISDYIDRKRSVDELKDLFIEVNNNILDSNKTERSVEECISILINLRCLLKTILRLSFIHTIYISPKSEDEYNMSLPKYLHNALCMNDPYNENLWNKAKSILLSFEKDNKYISIFNFSKSIGSFDRSDYHHALKELYEKTNSEADKLGFQYAEAIVDLCYNYQLEYSIRNSSKHYDINEFSSNVSEQWESFSKDFFSRLNKTWSFDSKNLDNRYLLDETCKLNKFMFSDKIIKKELPDFSFAVRVSDYSNNNSNSVLEYKDNICRYEFRFNNQVKQHKKAIYNNIWKKILIFVIPSIVIACLLEFALQALQTITDTSIENIFPLIYEYYGKARSFVETIVFLIIAEFSTWGLSKLVSFYAKKRFDKDVELLSLSEAIINFRRLVSDQELMRHHKVNSYTNMWHSDSLEKYNRGDRIDFVKTSAIKKYMKLQNNHASLFVESDLYKIEDIKPQATNIKTKLNKIIRLEELFGSHYGVVYQSKYNTLVVDPIINDENIETIGEYKTYERVIPSGSDGTIIVTRHNDKFVLLEQFRHAPRKIQYSFPRGFNENNLSKIDNVICELNDELKATLISEPVFIGSINPDSGLTGSSAAVYLAEIDCYELTNAEGILNVIEVTDAEFNQLINDNRNNKNNYFDDGFTLAAYSLYINHML